MNIIARLEYELAYYDSAVHRFNHYTTRTPPWQWRGTLHSPKLQHYWSLTIRLFNVISKTMIVEVLPLCRDAVGVFYIPIQLGHLIGWGLTPLQLMYSTSPSNWAISLGESYPFAINVFYIPIQLGCHLTVCKQMIC